MYNRLIIKGSYYDMGYALGKYFNKQIRKHYHGDSLEGFDSLLNKVKKELPLVYEEIRGRADGAQLDPLIILYLNSPEYYQGKDGCTSVIINKNDHFLFSHNEDDDVYDHEDLAIVKYDYGDYSEISFTTCKKLCGSCFGINSYGLIYSGNYLHHDIVDKGKLPRYLALRSIGSKKSSEEVIELLKTRDFASPFSINVGDRNNNTFNIEKAIDDIYIIEIKNHFGRANHFINIDNPKASVSSIFRQNKINELIRDVEDIEDIKKAMAYEGDDYNSSICLKYKTRIDDSITLANFSYDSQSRIISIKDVLMNDEYCFRYEDFEGEYYGF